MKVTKETAEHYKWGKDCDGWHLVKNDNLSIIYEEMPPHTAEVRHYHEKAQQFFYILKGTATLEMNGTKVILHEKEGMEVPPLVPHQMFNESDERIEFLVTSQPNSRGDRVKS
ncbi:MULTISPECIES: cupin domain-containing protein [unclassified Bacillus (in: firmicutes)]|uniref:cupin domain-containing protein n=1 Tax=unclassified Bacillus (in: firmicutes) TaxID=185979 RepID=UPI0008E2C1D9|nr:MULTISPECIES: cupin domain-containing protein [unclassified Bacillus (in: firmicutes)]SFB13474.1 Mannose-6-phosphate isomerase, cupin superfamily [Bacillus sp. UNCCL13]SFQ90005.1 Mannose-6-phosphate isomerase, cupin superfamily [Bacillus sp. cl95]